MSRAEVRDAGAGWWSVRVDDVRVSPVGSDLWPNRDRAGQAALANLEAELRHLIALDPDPHTTQLARTALGETQEGEILAQRELAAQALGLLEVVS